MVCPRRKKMGEPPIKRQRVNTKFHKIVFQHQFLCDVKVVAYVKEADLMSESKYELFENDPKDCATASLIQCIQDIEEQKHDHDLWQSLKNPHSGWILKEWNKEFLLLEDEIRNDPDFCYSMVVENNVEEFLASFPLPSLAFLKEVIPLAVRSIDYENIKKQLCTIAFHFETPELSFLPHQVLTIQNGFPKCPISVVMVTPYEENFWRKWSNPSKIVKDPNNWKMSTCLLPIQQAKLLLDEKVVAGIIVSPEKFLSFVKPFPNRLSNEQRLQKVRGEMTIDSLLKVLLSKEPSIMFFFLLFWKTFSSLSSFFVF